MKIHSCILTMPATATVRHGGLRFACHAKASWRRQVATASATTKRRPPRAFFFVTAAMSLMCGLTHAQEMPVFPKGVKKPQNFRELKQILEPMGFEVKRPELVRKRLQ